MRCICEKCRKGFPSWMYENGEYVTNVCISCYYKAVNQRELDIQKLTEKVLDEHGMDMAIGVYNKLTYPKKKSE